MLPAVGSFYTRPKDTCSRVRCGSTDAVCYKQDRSGSVVCSMGCLAKRLKPRVMAEPTPLLFTKDATDAKQATFAFLYSRASTLFVPPPNLRQRQEVLDNFAEQYFAHVYAHDNSLVFPGAGDVFLVSKFYVKLGPANTRILDWEQEWETGAETLEFVSPRQMINDIHSVLSSKPDAKAVILISDPVDIGDCVHHFRDFLVSFSDNERQRLFVVTRRCGPVNSGFFRLLQRGKLHSKE